MVDITQNNESNDIGNYVKHYVLRNVSIVDYNSFIVKSKKYNYINNEVGLILQ